MYREALQLFKGQLFQQIAAIWNKASVRSRLSVRGRMVYGMHGVLHALSDSSTGNSGWVAGKLDHHEVSIAQVGIDHCWYILHTDSQCVRIVFPGSLTMKCVRSFPESCTMGCLRSFPRKPYHGARS